MKKIKIKKVLQKPLQNAQNSNIIKYVSDMGIGFRVVDMNAEQLLHS